MSSPLSRPDPREQVQTLLDGSPEDLTCDLIEDTRRYAYAAAVKKQKCHGLPPHVDPHDVSQEACKNLVKEKSKYALLPRAQVLRKATEKAINHVVARIRQRLYRERKGELEGKPRRYPRQVPMSEEWQDRNAVNAVTQWDLEQDFSTIVEKLSDDEKALLLGKLEEKTEREIRSELGMTRHQFRKSLERVQQQFEPLICNRD